MDAGIREVLQKFFPGEEIVSVGPHGSVWPSFVLLFLCY